MLLKFLLHDIWNTCTLEYLRFTGIQSATLRKKEREKNNDFFAVCANFLCVYSQIKTSDFFLQFLQVRFAAFILSTKLTYHFVFLILKSIL